MFSVLCPIHQQFIYSRLTDILKLWGPYFPPPPPPNRSNSSRRTHHSLVESSGDQFKFMLTFPPICASYWDFSSRNVAMHVTGKPIYIGRVDRVIEGACIHRAQPANQSDAPSRRRENMFQRRAAGCCSISPTWSDTDVSKVDVRKERTQGTQESRRCEKD